jgi:hypothetical protein
MFVRTENTTDKDVLLVIDEIDSYLGQIHLEDFIDCMDGDKEVLMENEFEYFYVSKEQLDIFLNSFSAPKITMEDGE